MSASNGGTGQPNPASTINGVANIGARLGGATGPAGAVGNIGGGLLQALTNPSHSGNSAANIGGSALKGAGTGAAIGSIVPGVGTAIGGIGGGLLGALSSLF